LFIYCDQICFKAKNLYNYANYIIRQTSFALNKDELATDEFVFLFELQQVVDKYNITTKSKYKLELNKTYKMLNYSFLDFYFKTLEQTDNPYKLLGAKIAQQVLKTLFKDWKAFFASMKDYKTHSEKYNGKPSIPKYLKKDGRKTVIFSNQSARIKDNFLSLPFTKDRLDVYIPKEAILKQVFIKPL
jgi:putative transposase